MHSFVCSYNPSCAGSAIDNPVGDLNGTKAGRQNKVMRAPFPSARVLIVDDDHDQRVGLSDMLSALGFVAETAEDGEEALERLGSAPAEAIVPAPTMPRMAGFQLLRSLLHRGALPR